jgi:hypothetical protein
MAVDAEMLAVFGRGLDPLLHLARLQARFVLEQQRDRTGDGGR